MQEKSTTNQAPPTIQTTLNSPITTQAVPITSAEESTTPVPVAQPTVAPTVSAQTTEPKIEESTVEKVEETTEEIKNKPWVRRGIAIALTAQGLYGIYKSIYFILVGLPMLETQLEAHLVSADDVSSIAAHAILVAISTIASMFFAMQLMKNKAGKILYYLIAGLLFLTNTLLFNYITQLPILQLWENFLNTYIL